MFEKNGQIVLNDKIKGFFMTYHYLMKSRTDNKAEKILFHLVSNPMSVKEVTMEFDISERQVYKYFENLGNALIVKKEGFTKKFYTDDDYLAFNEGLKSGTLQITTSTNIFETLGFLMSLLFLSGMIVAGFDDIYVLAVMLLIFLLFILFQNSFSDRLELRI